MSIEQIGPIQTAELKAVVFDFGLNELEEDETIVSVVSVTAQRYSGKQDANPAEILEGEAAIVGRTVVQRVAFRQFGTTYLLQCTVAGSGSLALQHTLSALLPNVAAT